MPIRRRTIQHQNPYYYTWFRQQMPDGTWSRWRRSPTRCTLEQPAQSASAVTEVSLRDAGVPYELETIQGDARPASWDPGATAWDAAAGQHPGSTGSTVGSD